MLNQENWPGWSVRFLSALRFHLTQSTHTGQEAPAVHVSYFLWLDAGQLFLPAYGVAISNNVSYWGNGQSQQGILFQTFCQGTCCLYCVITWIKVLVLPTLYRWEECSGSFRWEGKTRFAPRCTWLQRLSSGAQGWVSRLNGASSKDMSYPWNLWIWLTLFGKKPFVIVIKNLEIGLCLV